MTIKLTKEHCQDYHEAVEYAKSLEAEEKRIREEIAKAESDIERIEGAIVEANDNRDAEIERRAQARVDGKKVDNSPLPSSEALEGELSVAEAFLEKLQEKSKAVMASRQRAHGSSEYQRRVMTIPLFNEAGFSHEMLGHGSFAVKANVEEIADLTIRDLFYLYRAQAITRGEGHFQSFAHWLKWIELSGGIEGIDEELREIANIAKPQQRKTQTIEEILETKRAELERLRAEKEDAA